MNRVFLIGDSIRQGYDRPVREMLSGRAEVYYPRDNCRFAAYTLRHFPDWIEAEIDPATVTLIHWNCGLWDCGQYYPEKEPFTPIEFYQSLLRRIVLKMRVLYPQAKQIFATSTPVIEARYTDGFMRLNTDIVRYNDAAKAVMAELGVAIDDLHAAASTLDESAWSPDGTHLYTPIGTKTLSEAVAKSILDALDK